MKKALVVATLVLVATACSSARRGLRPGVTPAEADAEIVRFLDETVSRLAADENFNGVVLYARDETVLFHKAYGIANRQNAAPNEISTRFNLASASKMFTAVAIAKLVEEGRISFDDPIGKFLGPEWVSAKVGEKVRVGHLLNHTSGLGMYWGEKWDAVSAQIKTIDDFRQVITDDLAFEPGSRHEYSNTGYIMLGAIIEKVSVETYYDYVGRTIFEPCGMKSTGFYANNQVQDGMAIGYFEDSDDDGKLKDNLGLHGAIGASAGGGWSTASDFHRFFLAMNQNNIITEATRAVLWSPKPHTPGYGYGFQVDSGFAGPGWVGHDGGFPGVEAFATYHPATGHTLVVLSNYYDSALPLMKAMRSEFQDHYGNAKIGPD